MTSRALCLLVIVGVGACGDDSGTPASGSGSTTDSSSTTTSTETGDMVDSSTAVADSAATSTTTTTTSPPMSTSSSTDPGSTGPDPSTDDGSSSDGPPPRPPNGCADGDREALDDEELYPDIAACSGGWQVPGMLANTTFCRREGGDDGPNPQGRGCSVEDLCSEDWHVCDSLTEVSDAGVRNCEDIFWNGAFYATRQSGEGANTCDPTGLNDVFGCGDIGYPMINGCTPLNRSTANLCVSLPEPWSCDESITEEAEFIVKAGPQFGGVLCCRD